MKSPQTISLNNVRVHNLKGVSLDLPVGALICLTGISGSGKSSFAFDTLYVEGQRRYVESLSQHARMFLIDMPKPDLDYATGISPTIAIEQKTAANNPRSTVGTLTEIYDYLRVLFARVATPYCPISGEAVRPRSPEEIIREITALSEKPLVILAPFIRAKKGELKDDIEAIRREGFTRVRINKEIVSLHESIALNKKKAHDLDVVIDRLQARPTSFRILESVTQALRVGKGSCIVYNVETEEEILFSIHAYSPKSGISYPPLNAQDFSFNSPGGMCQECNGMGATLQFDRNRIVDETKSIAENCCSICGAIDLPHYKKIYEDFAKRHCFSLTTPWSELPQTIQQLFFEGDGVWHGALMDGNRRYNATRWSGVRQKLERCMRPIICPSCNGSRLKPYPATARFFGKKIFEICRMSIDECLFFFQQIELQGQDKLIAEEIVKEIITRLNFLKNVGLEYLQLERTAPTLSGGEAQRVRLASQIGSGLVGVTYILDEPSIGLHPSDNTKLIRSLEHLRDKGNTVIVVEHDEETIRAANHIVDFGPKAGHAGGTVVYQGDFPGLLACKQSLTGSYLAKEWSIPTPKRRRKAKGHLQITQATHHNLKDVNAQIPLGCFIAVTGVSGSGKSSLFLETLFPALSNRLMKSDLVEASFGEIIGIEQIDKIIEIDQSPIGRTPRSNPATYIKVFDDIRLLYSQLPESQARGYKSGRFSFNVREGSCPECAGMGKVRIEMDFLEDSWVQCPLCIGRRFDSQTLSIRFKEKNIYDVLEMDAKEAKELFGNVFGIKHKLETLIQVGLDYIKLGQSSTTLSGGEAQRIKLAKELARPDTGKTLYILDEPTTGLHFYDIKHLLEVLHALVDKGNTVIVIEHNMDLVKTADWIIEMGPGSGAAGGTIIVSGTPEQIMKKSCPTGNALKHVFSETTHKPSLPAPSICKISVKGAEQNNLKQIAVDIPHNAITICTGPSGAGKSSFAFDTVFAEGQRRYIESLSPYIRQFLRQMPKPKVEYISGLLPAVAIEQRTYSQNPRSTVGTMTEIYDFLRLFWTRVGIPHCPKTGKEIKAISKELVTERILTYPEGSKVYILAPIDLKKTNFSDTLKQLLQQGYVRIRLNKTYYEIADHIPYDPKKKNELLLVIDRIKIDPSMRARIFEAVSTAATIGQQRVIVQKEERDYFFNLVFAVEETGESYPEITPKTFAFNLPEGMCPECEGLGFLSGREVCPSCNGSRLHPLARHVTIENRSIYDICMLPADQALAFFEKVSYDTSDLALVHVYEEIVNRLRFLLRVGVGYLSLCRVAGTLSGGESQRIHLAKQIGSGLTQVLYVLDEPTTGLHAKDAELLLEALSVLKSNNNTLLMVENNRQALKNADYIIEFGPASGKEGGYITATGKPHEILSNPELLTTQYLAFSAKQFFHRRGRGKITIRNASIHNLKNITVEIPCGLLACLTGVSGSGKSTLLHDVIRGFAEKRGPLSFTVEGLGQFSHIVSVDQQRIGTTVRSDVSSYIEVSGFIRALFADTSEARIKCYTPAYFSPYHYSGMCPTCQGLGYQIIEMYFLPAVHIICPACHGLRLHPLSLAIRYKGKNMGEVLQMSIAEAREFFSENRPICKIFDMMIAVGLGYLSLGQEIQTLSNGENRRVRLAWLLAHSKKEKTLYLLDEPTAGLHAKEIEKLLEVIEHLIDSGNTVIAIEHNLDFIQASDYIVDLGPEAGDKGGMVVATGTPEAIAQNRNSYTGAFLEDAALKSRWSLGERPITKIAQSQASCRVER